MGNNDHFGLDIGTTEVRVVQLRQSGGNPDLVAYGSAPLPAGLAQSDSPVDQQKIAEMIKQLVKDANISTKNTVVGIPSAQAFATVITIPKLAHQELEKAIRLQADQYIPMSIDQVKLDWSVVGQGKNDNEMEVLLVAAPNSVVNKYLNIVENAGLELESLEINAIALTRSLMPKNTAAIVILDIGSVYADIAIIHENAPKLIRSINIGGATFIKAVAQSLGLEEGQAEQFTKKFGLTSDKLEGQVLKAIKPSLDSLIGDLDKSIQFFTSSNEGIKLEKIILTGGTAALPGLPAYLANAINIPVMLANPWTQVSYPAAISDQIGNMSPEYAVAIGLAENSMI